MKKTAPRFRTEGDKRDLKNLKLFLQCSECEKDIRQLKDTDTIDVRKAYYCEDCSDGATHLNTEK